MDKMLSSNNVSFDILKNSKDFLKHIINDISSCILLLDKDMMLYAFNDPMKNILPIKPTSTCFINDVVKPLAVLSQWRR